MRSDLDYKSSLKHLPSFYLLRFLLQQVPKDSVGSLLGWDYLDEPEPWLALEAQ